MNIKNIKINKKVASKLVAYTLAGTMTATVLSGCNYSLLDTTYHFDKAMINNETSSILLNVKSWRDYQGEQIQIITDDNFVLLTSSFDTHCFSGNSDSYSAEIISDMLTSEVYDLANKNEKGIYNKSFFDTQWTFNKAIIFNGNNAVIIPIIKWRDYDGEQLQVVTSFGMTLLLSSFNSKLVYDEKSSMKAYDFAKMYVGEDGKVEDLSKDLTGTSSFNYDIIDTKFSFNKVMILKDNAVTILSIDEWNDYEGEQLQIKVSDGPKMLTAAYDAILINDQNSNLKAIDIAKYLSDKVNDVSNDEAKGVFNKQILDLDYGFSSSIITNRDSASAIKLKEWNDYEGEQLQIILNTGDIILGTSMTINLLNNGTNTLNTSSIARFYTINNGKCIDEVNNEILSTTYNKTFIDFTKNNFKYALKINNDNITILPLKSWKDYENASETEKYIDSDGNVKTRTVKGEPNCEQLQLVLPDGTALLTTAYNTVLVDNKRDILEIAELFRGSNGVVIDLTPVLGEPSNSTWNKTIFDTRYTFDSAIISNGDKNIVVDVYKWHDYVDGEQVQLTFNDRTNILTSYYNTTLVSSKSEGIVELLSNAFQGIYDNGRTR